MKAYGAKVLAVAIAFILFIQPAAAITVMSIPFVTTDSVVFVQPLELTDLTITEFNQTQYAENHDANLDISGSVVDPQFNPIVVDNSGIIDAASPTLPSMKQSANDSFSYRRTYFFRDVLS